MKSLTIQNNVYSKIIRDGQEILSSNRIPVLFSIPHHGKVSVFEHSVGVAYMSILLAHYLHIKVYQKEMIRGALLHDYYLYNWHEKEKWHRLHGFKHPYFALRNASSDYKLSEREKDIIKCHMFPLTPFPPRFRESILVCVADKIVSLCDYFSYPYMNIDLFYNLWEANN